MSNERHTVTLSAASYDLVKAFAELSGQTCDLATDQLVGEGAGYRLLAEAKTKGVDRPYVAAVAKQRHAG